MVRLNLLIIFLFLITLLAGQGHFAGISFSNTPDELNQISNQLISNALADKLNALEQLGRLNSLPAVKLILTVDDRQPEVKSALIKTLSQINNPESVKWLMQTGLSFPDDRIRLVITIGFVQSPLTTEEMAQFFIQALDDRNPTIRQIATAGLGRFSDERIIKSTLGGLEKSLLDRESYQVRETAMRTLAQLTLNQPPAHLPSAIEILFEAHHEPDFTLQRLLESLLTNPEGLGGNPAVLDYIIRKEFSSATHPHARALAARVISQQLPFFINNSKLETKTMEDYVNLLTADLKDETPSISLDKIWLLGQLGNSEKLPEALSDKIISALSNCFEIFGEAELRLATASTLLNVNHLAFPEYVLKVLDEEIDWRVRHALKLVLIEFMESSPHYLKNNLEILVNYLSKTLTAQGEIVEILKEFTGQDFGTDEAAWKNWLLLQTFNKEDKEFRLPSLLQNRSGVAKLTALSQNGGDAQTEQAVRDGLRWLLRHQETDGRWSCRKHNPYKGHTPLPIFTNEDELVDVSTTGLAILCFLHAGYTHQTGKYREVIQAGLEYLANAQDEQGLINFEQEHIHTPRCLPHGPDHGSLARRYNHNIATLTLVEAYAMTKDPWLAPYVQKALDHARYFREPTYGWSFYLEPTDIGTSVFYITALAVARECTDLKVSDTELREARDYLARLTHSSSGRLHFLSGPPYCFGGYDSTATGLFCRLLLERVSPNQLNTDELKFKAADYLIKHPPIWKSHYQSPVSGREASLLNRPIGQTDLLSVEDDILNQWYWYYATLSFLHLPDKQEYWQRWQPKIKEILLSHQRPSGDWTGSWDPECVWATVGGRMYSTTFAILTMEAYYSYDLK